MKEVKWEDVKEKLVEFNGSDRFGTVFDAVCKTIAYYANGVPKKKKEETKPEESEK